jgi:hypothetical protein
MTTTNIDLTLEELLRLRSELELNLGHVNEESYQPLHAQSECQWDYLLKEVVSWNILKFLKIMFNFCFSVGYQKTFRRSG